MRGKGIDSRARVFDLPSRGEADLELQIGMIEAPFLDESLPRVVTKDDTVDVPKVAVSIDGHALRSEAQLRDPLFCSGTRRRHALTGVRVCCEPSRHCLAV